jgi:hypothetical protein
MARVVGYMGPECVIEDAGGNFDTLSVGSDEEGLDAAACRPSWWSDLGRAEVVDDGALFDFR